MTNEQVTISLAGLILAAVAYGRYYMDAKIDPIERELERAIREMIRSH